MVKINAPIAQIPRVTAISTNVGVYSAIFPQGPGINPGNAWRKLSDHLRPQ